MDEDMDRGFRSRGFAPVKVDEEIDVKIEAVGEKGDGIAKKDGFVLFIPGVNEGDEVKVRVTKVLRRVGFAEVVGSETAPSEAGEAPAEESEAEKPADTENFGEELEKPEEPEAEKPKEEAPEEEAPAEEPQEEKPEEAEEEKKE